MAAASCTICTSPKGNIKTTDLSYGHVFLHCDHFHLRLMASPVLGTYLLLLHTVFQAGISLTCRKRVFPPTKKEKQWGWGGWSSPPTRKKQTRGSHQRANEKRWGGRGCVLQLHHGASPGTSSRGDGSEASTCLASRNSASIPGHVLAPKGWAARIRGGGEGERGKGGFLGRGRGSALKGCAERLATIRVCLQVQILEVCGGCANVTSR